jgi:uncharacterized protein
MVVTDAADHVTLDRKVAFLSAMPGVAQVIETHMAFVFLTRKYAFKLKKPVCFGYFDHRRLAARAHACAEEVRLNRALAADVYIQVIPLVLIGAELSLGGDGLVVDWLVQMRRLPETRMLDTIIATRQGPTQAEVLAVSGHLAQFYRRQQAFSVTSGFYFAHLRREQQVNAANLQEMAHVLADPALVQVAQDLTDRIARVQSEIASREQAGLVVEGHGDLRPEHVCLTDPPVIFDRVESAVEMRVIDIFDEVGYLGAECALLGRPDVGQTLLAALQKMGFAPPSQPLMATYAMFRLVTRARLALDHLRDENPRTPAKWPLRAHTYLAEARRLSDVASG